MSDDAVPDNGSRDAAARRLVADLLQFRRDLEFLPAAKRASAVSTTGGILMEKIRTRCQDLGVEFPTGQFRFTGRLLPSYTDAYALAGQVLNTLKREFPEAFSNYEPSWQSASPPASAP